MTGVHAVFFRPASRKTFLLMKISVAERRVWLHTDNKSRGSASSLLISPPGPQPGIPAGSVASAGTKGAKPVTAISSD